MSFRITLLTFTLLFASLPVMSDVLLIDVIEKEPVNASTGLLRPKNGQSMATVKTQFGEPLSATDAVGEPPITRWSYEKFSVYFEHHLVIHSVVKKPAKAK